MKNKKLMAFTLAELLIVIVVASIVIAMAFLVLNMVRKQIVLIQKSYHRKQEVQFFETTFARDFNRGTASYKQKSDILVLKSTHDSISYIFSDKVIIRENDTFQIEIANKKLFLDGKEVQEKTIDAIEINLSESYGGKQLFTQKVKSASYYINN